MAKQIIILERNSNGTTQNVTAAMWFPITAGAAAQTGGSQWSGASAAENTAIQNGSIAEEVVVYSFPVATPTANIKAYFQQAWTNRNTQIAGNGANLWYGVFYDGTAWSA